MFSLSVRAWLYSKFLHLQCLQGCTWREVIFLTSKAHGLVIKSSSEFTLLCHSQLDDLDVPSSLCPSCMMTCCHASELDYALKVDYGEYITIVQSSNFRNSRVCCSMRLGSKKVKGPDRSSAGLFEIQTEYGSCLVLLRLCPGPCHGPGTSTAESVA